VSWLFGKKEEKKPPSDNVILCVSVIFKQEGDDIVVSCRARTPGDLDRLKRIADEMIGELLGEYETKRPGPASVRRER